MMSKPKFIIINSFDRSGSSFLGNMLSKHPEIETLFHPFNSSIFSETRFEHWKNFYVKPDANKLVENVIKGNFDRDIIKSHWLYDYSSSLEIEDGKLYIIKTTNLHFKISWFKKNFPEIDIFPLIRNPIQILNSLVRNDLIEKWYGEWANTAMRKFVESSIFLNENQIKKFHSLSDSKELMLATIVINNEIMLSECENDYVLNYETIKTDCNDQLSFILERYLLKQFDFSPFVNMNFNLEGADYNNRSMLFNNEEMDNYKEIIDCFRIH